MPFPQNRNADTGGGLIPPPAQPVRRFTTPSVGDGFWAERVDVSARDYVPLTRGTLYSTIKNAQKTVIEQFPRLYFLKETLDPFFYPWALRLWATDEDAESTYNAEVTYLKEDVDYPMYARTYTLRREVYDALPALPIGQPLSGVISVKIVAGGVGYTKDDLVTFGATAGVPAAATLVVDEAGAIINVVLVAEGTLYATPPTVTVTSDAGIGADLVAIMQDQTAVLTSQKKVELADDDPLSQEKVRVLRIYETVPGPYVTSTKIDDDGMVITTKHRRQFCSEITPEETIEDGNWCKTTSKETDSDVICEEVIECRPVPGNPMVGIKIDEDGKSLATIRTLKDTTTIVDHEEINGAGDWIRIGKEPVSDLVAWEVETARLVPGNPMVGTKIDKDGITRATVRTLKDTTTIVEGEVVSGAGVWVTTEKEAVSDLVAYEIVTAREVEPNGTVNPVISFKVDGDHEIVSQETRLKETSAITPSATEAGGNITTVEAEAVTDLVANQITTVSKFLDKASYEIRIPESIIPLEFRATIPTITESHILAGTASMPTLSGGNFAVRETQLTELLYERRTEGFGNIVFPIEQHGQETSSEYGGAILDVHRTLHNVLLVADEGEDIVDSYVHPIGQGLMWFRETKKRPSTDAEWPVVPSRLWDDNMRVEYDEEFQWVATGTAEDAAPGGSFAWVSEVKGKDKWHAQKVNSLKPAPPYISKDTALIQYQMKPFEYPGWLAFSGTGYYTKGSAAKLTLHKIRTWWLKSSTEPTCGPTGGGFDVEFDEIITGDVIINDLSNTRLEYARNVLHDGFTIGILTFPATTPSATQYALGTPSGTDNQNIASIYSPGTAGGYSIGDVITIASGGFTMSVTVTSVYDVGAITGLIGTTSIVDPSGTYPPGTYGPIAGSGGGGSGVLFNVWSVDVVTYTPGTAWIGEEHVIGGYVTVEKEKDIWKCQTESVVMR